MKTADEWFNEGDALFQKGKFTEANECFDKALEIDSKYMPAYRGKFRSLSAEGKNLEVIDWCKKALAVDPNFKFAHNSMGVAHQRRGEDQEALEAFNKAISIDPNFFFAYHNKGNSLERLQRFEEAIQALDKAIELNPTLAQSIYSKASVLQSLGRDQEALDLYEEAGKKSSKDLLGLCNKAKLLSKLGRNKEALIDLKRVQEIQNSGHIDVEMGPGQRNFITSTLKMITELENIETQTEEVIKQQDQQNPVVQKLIDNMRKLKEKKEQVTTKLIAGMENKNNDDLVKQLSTLKEEFVQIKQELMDVKKDIKQIKSQLEDMREELDNKMDDFRKKLDAELGKADLSPEERTKLKDYFNAFIETFSSTHVTSQVIDSGQVQIDSDNSKATLLSVVASFTPFIGSVLSAGIKSIGDFLQSKEMKTNARKIKGLASDATRLSQIIGEAAYKIVIDKQKQKQILQVTNEDLKRISGNILQKISGFCKDLGEQIDVYLYTNLYQTASARLGHNDANHMIELWLDEKIDPYSVQEDIVRQAISMNSNEKEEAASPSLNAGSPGAQPKLENRSSCCNMF